jgi:hypothetical protein
MTGFHHARLMQNMRTAGVCVEDLARAWASVDGKEGRFDSGKNLRISDDPDGTYAGYMIEMEEIIDRAIRYALERQRK